MSDSLDQLAEQIVNAIHMPDCDASTGAQRSVFNQYKQLVLRKLEASTQSLREQLELMTQEREEIAVILAAHGYDHMADPLPERTRKLGTMRLHLKAELNKQAEAAEAVLATQREELERLRNMEHVAVTLAREVRGAEAIEGPALRAALGNSNVSVLLHWADTVMACTPTKSAP